MAAVVMTGGTSGFGLPTAEHLRDAGQRALLGSRGPSADGDAEVLALDLTSLDAVRSFAGQVRDRLGEQLIDALVLNAGIVRPDATARSADGHEMTFAVNHLAHYLLLRLLLDRMAQGGVVVLTPAAPTTRPSTGAWRRRVTPTPGCWRTRPVIRGRSRGPPVVGRRPTPPPNSAP
ncbi:SDR family NAD(P)-dependent oxidoreductase [Ornithinimicrobium faecis]|uniref:SDR family NAD(P)-dependent oxidoreductase n=1 Tax=Ornithinimicrobium faecis TaxID=2934158 RepID=A0ABY4YU36_9MICO|nr:SDR family NAD(P)-dependent oxidoreductase [Ornithinimicrobium sp. HY1793]USQ80278.1 SDR family NAD(P)-dependent oxidoreductase [Ornithinimicrobium sp. HY1793]